MNSRVNMCCLVLKASSLWSDGYRAPSCSTKQCWCRSLQRFWGKIYIWRSDLKLCQHFGPGTADVTVLVEKKPLLLLLLHPLCIQILTPTHVLVLLRNAERVVETIFQCFSSVLTDSQSVLRCFGGFYFFVRSETKSGPTSRSRSPHSCSEKVLLMKKRKRTTSKKWMNESQDKLGENLPQQTSKWKKTSWGLAKKKTPLDLHETNHCEHTQTKTTTTGTLKGNSWTPTF